MDEKAYIAERVDHQIAWYSKRSAQDKGRFLGFQISAAVTASAIPIIAQFVDLSWASVTVAVLGGVSAVTVSVISLCQFREHWAHYRTTAETLKHEKFLYLTESGPYAAGRDFSLFTERIESLISQENTAWKQRVCERKEGKPHG